MGLGFNYAELLILKREIVIETTKELHLELARESPQGFHIIAYQSGHLIYKNKLNLEVGEFRNKFALWSTDNDT
jgi:hypothetical protein